MAIPSDAHYVPGTFRRAVRLGDGSLVSRQTAENIFAQSVGAKNDYALRQAYRKAGDITRSTTYQRNLIRARASGMSDKQFKALAARLSAEPRTERGKIANTEPGSPLDRYLKATGRRSDDAPWAAGETPSVYA